MRLAKYIAHSGTASRRHAERLVTSGRVQVDGERVVDPARGVDESNEVSVDGRPVQPEPLEHWMVNKPIGVVSTAHDPEGRPKVTDLADAGARLFPVGRLDADASGLILLTNDGELANRLMHPRFEVERTYRVRVKGSVGESARRTLRRGVELEEGRTAPARVRQVTRGPGWTELEITIREGRNRQVRRMCEAVGHPVRALVRTRFGPLELGRLAAGGARRLRRAELEALARVGEAGTGRTGAARAGGRG